jgi:hypothetical protein
MSLNLINQTTSQFQNWLIKQPVDQIKNFVSQVEIHFNVDFGPTNWTQEVNKPYSRLKDDLFKLAFMWLVEEEIIKNNLLSASKPQDDAVAGTPHFQFPDFHQAVVQKIMTSTDEKKSTLTAGTEQNAQVQKIYQEIAQHMKTIQNLNQQIQQVQADNASQLTKIVKLQQTRQKLNTAINKKKSALKPNDVAGIIPNHNPTWTPTVKPTEITPRPGKAQVIKNEESKIAVTNQTKPASQPIELLEIVKDIEEVEVIDEKISKKRGKFEEGFKKEDALITETIAKTQRVLFLFLNLEQTFNVTIDPAFKSKLAFYPQPKRAMAHSEVSEILDNLLEVWMKKRVQSENESENDFQAGISNSFMGTANG